MSPALWTTRRKYKFPLRAPVHEPLLSATPGKVLSKVSIANGQKTRAHLCGLSVHNDTKYNKQKVDKYLFLRVAIIDER